MITPSTLRQLAHRTGYLLYLGLAPEVRLCTRATVQAIGQDWVHGDFDVARFEIGPHGVESVQITLQDIDYGWARRLRQQFRPGIACELHLLAGSGDSWEAQQLFSGELVRPRITARNAIQLDAGLATGNTAVAPRVPFESRHSLARGAEVVVNGTMYRVE